MSILLGFIGRFQIIQKVIHKNGISEARVALNICPKSNVDAPNARSEISKQTKPIIAVRYRGLIFFRRPVPDFISFKALL